VLGLLEENVPTAKELARRKEFMARVTKIAARKSPVPGPHPSSEEMLREDRLR
jgi:hypothetical protein